MRPNPTTDELNRSIQNAQADTDAMLDEIGMSYADAIDNVSEIDALDAVKSAALDTSKGRPLAHVRLHDGRESEGYRAVEDLGHVVRIDDRHRDGGVYARLERADLDRDMGKDERTCRADGCDEPARERSSYCSDECSPDVDLTPGN